VIADRNEQTAATRKKVRENVTPAGWLSNAPFDGARRAP